ncbi:MAG: contractile injection system tape measure protein [Ferruginibacter sp.]
MQHIIKRQILEFQLDNGLDAFRIQHKMSEYNDKLILATLEKVMDELSAEDEIIQLDKVEIDIGTLSLKDFEKAIPANKLYESVSARFVEMIKNSGVVNEPAKTGRSLRTARQWLFYMKHGYFEWNTVDTNESWYNQALEAFACDFDSVTALRSLIVSDANALKRIIQQHPEQLLVKLVELLTAENQAQLITAIDELGMIFKIIHRRSGSIFFTERTTRKKIWELVMITAAPFSGKLTTAMISGNILTQFINDQISKDEVADILKQQIKITRPFLQKVWNEKITISQNIPVDQLKPETDKGLSQENKQSDNNNERHQPDIMMNSKNETVLQNEFDAKKDGVKEIKQTFLSGKPGDDNNIVKEQVNAEIFSAYAGLVLVHPFLPFFFGKLNLVSGSKFTDQLAWQKALYLLHYLATGKPVAEEYELVIPKLLCAYPFTGVVEKDIELLVEEMEEADNMLAEVIRQWGKLGNTSLAGLREGFLHRKGKFFRDNNNEYLQIESSSIDMLLDHLPWTIGMIKLPWMKNLLRVEWR